MMKRLCGVMLAAVMLIVVSGCGDEVKTTTVKQTTQQSEPEMVAPGEMIVE